MTAARCHECAAPLAAEQRWCVVCGARQAGADPRTLLFGPSAPADPAPDASSATPLLPTDSRPAALATRRRRAALPVALASLVGLIVVTGTSVPASLAGSAQQPFTVVLPAQVAQQVVAQTPPVEETPAPPLDDYVEPVIEEPLAETPVAETPVAEEETPADETPPAETPPAEAPAETSPIRHVFLIALGAADLTTLANDATAAPYLAGTLVKSGTLLSDYRTIARGTLANRIALVSGQGPTAQTLADCTTYGDVSPADALPDGQTGGDGCVYGYETGHLGDQLRALERTWKAYVEPAAGAAAAPTARAAACRTDAATTRRNPFLWFRATVEADDCDDRNVPLTQLARDLRDAETTPALSWIASDAQQGTADADRFLEQVVPQIQNSPAYADGGLIVIVGDQPPAPATPAPPAATTPTTPVPPPAATTPAPPPAPTPPAPVEPPATTPTTPVPPPATTPTEPPTTTPQDPPPATTPTEPPADTTPRAAAAAAAAPRALAPTAYANVGDAAAAGAGTPVGALLISSYTPSGRVDTTPANAFTLLRTLQQIYGVDPLGYAAARGITPLSDDLFSVAP